MNWFNAHLNIGYAIILVISAIIGVLTVFTGNTAAIVIGGLISLVLTLGGSAWILDKKGQSLWFLLLVLVMSLALIIVALVLPNKRTGQGETPKINDADYYRQRDESAK